MNLIINISRLRGWTHNWQVKAHNKIVMVARRTWHVYWHNEDALLIEMYHCLIHCKKKKKWMKAINKEWVCQDWHSQYDLTYWLLLTRPAWIYICRTILRVAIYEKPRTAAAYDKVFDILDLSWFLECFYVFVSCICFEKFHKLLIIWRSNRKLVRQYSFAKCDVAFQTALT